MLIWILLDSSRPFLKQSVDALFQKPFDAGTAGVGDLEEFDFMASIAKGVVSGDQGESLPFPLLIITDVLIWLIAGFNLSRVFSKSRRTRN